MGGQNHTPLDFIPSQREHKVLCCLVLLEGRLGSLGGKGLLLEGKGDGGPTLRGLLHRDVSFYLKRTWWQLKRSKVKMDSKLIMNDKHTHSKSFFVGELSGFGSFLGFVLLSPLKEV